MSAFNLSLTVMVFLKIPFSLGSQIFHSVSHLRSHLFCFTVDLCLGLFHCLNVTTLVMQWNLNCTNSVQINSLIHVSRSSPTKAHPCQRTKMLIKDSISIFTKLLNIFYQPKLRTTNIQISMVMISTTLMDM